MKMRVCVVTAVVVAGLLVVGSGCSPGLIATTDGVGDPCVPTQEREPSFTGFDEKMITLETESPSCKTRVCLINHFRGRVSCPLGQSSTGEHFSGSGCMTAGPVRVPVTGGDPPLDPRRKAQVSAQCADRTADQTVFCSCRCANKYGRTDDGEKYCTCGDGFECADLITVIGSSLDHLAGAYCVKTGTDYDPNTSCNAGDVQPASP